MAFNSKDQYKEKDMNTRGIELYNPKGFDPSALALGFWNKLTDIKIYPELPKAKQKEGESNYDRENYGAVYLTLSKVQALLESIRKDLLPGMQNAPNEVREVGVFSGEDKYIGVGNGVKYTGKITPYISLCKVNPETKELSSEICYEFNRIDTVTNYEADGKHEIRPRHAELEIFIVYLEEAVKAMTHAQVHAERNTNKYYTEKQADNLKAIMTALDIPVDEKKSSKGNSGFNSSRRVPSSSDRGVNVGGASYSNAGSVSDVEKELEGIA